MVPKKQIPAHLRTVQRGQPQVTPDHLGLLALQVPAATNKVACLVHYLQSPVRLAQLGKSALKTNVACTFFLGPQKFMCWLVVAVRDRVGERPTAETVSLGVERACPVNDFETIVGEHVQPASDHSSRSLILCL